MVDAQGLHEAAAQTVHQRSKRPCYRKYVDPPQLKDLIRKRKLLRGNDRVQASVEIQAQRKIHRANWLKDAVQKAATGDAQALLILKKRQSTHFAHQVYSQRAGGPSEAVKGLQVFYKHK